jgi:hypothetical protein
MEAVSKRCIDISKLTKVLKNMEEMQWFEDMQCIIVQLIIYDGSCIQKVHRYIKSHKGLK